MNCLIYQCEKTANYPFLGCGITHSVKLRDILKSLKDYQNGELSISDLYPGKGIDLSIEQIKHYALYV